MENGSLAQLLHENKQDQKLPLNLKLKIKIA